MSQFVRHSNNFVNLGRLYHYGPLKKSMPGWAYFEDGSMFIAPGEHLHHKNLEMRMNIAAQLVSHPGVRLHAQSNLDEDTRSRFVMVSKAGKDYPKKEMIVSARSASDGERIIPSAKPFLLFSFQLDSTGRRTPLVKYQKKDEKIMYKSPYIKEALHTFRGTLIDGQLQPNVRLNNGLLLRGMPRFILRAERGSGSVPAQREESKSRFVPAEKGESKSRFVPAEKGEPRSRFVPIGRRELSLPARAKSPLRHGMSVLASKELELQAKERELALREELLQWKQKTFGLAQQLAKGSSGENRRQRMLRTMSRNPDSNDRSFDSQFPENITRPRSRPRYSDEDINPIRYPVDNTRPRTTSMYRDENSHSYDERDPVDEPTAAHISKYKVDVGGRASLHRANIISSDSTQTTRYAPLAEKAPATTPSDSFDTEKPSTREGSEHQSTSDTSLFLGTDTSAPPELDGLRTLIDELDKMDKRQRPVIRRRRRSR